MTPTRDELAQHLDAYMKVLERVRQKGHELEASAPQATVQLEQAVVIGAGLALLAEALLVVSAPPGR